METISRERLLLLQKEVRRDAILVVEDKDGGRHKHEVNKALMANKSEYFKKQFDPNWDTKLGSHVEEFIVNCDADGLASAVEWVMEGKVELTEETAWNVLEVANYLLIDDLSNHCQQVMIG